MSPLIVNHLISKLHLNNKKCISTLLKYINISNIPKDDSVISTSNS